MDSPLSTSDCPADSGVDSIFYYTKETVYCKLSNCELHLITMDEIHPLQSIAITAAAHGLCALLGLRAELTLASGLQLWC